jgi:lipopolysaccharide/colanic/teichoic acid biosynthesis glycosyltransferase
MIRQHQGGFWSLAPGSSARAVKRSFDVVAAATGLLLCLPLLLVTALLVRLRLGRPVLFRQPRAGYRGRPFVLNKFRTMSEARDASGTLLPDSERITPLGRGLRAMSLDELPQLWNVLKGDMSLVGPRPLLLEYLPYYSTQQARRHDVRPGLTGWAQVNGRCTIGWEQKVAHDLWYVEHQSLLLDLRILARTVHKVFSARDAHADGRHRDPMHGFPRGFDRTLLQNTREPAPAETPSAAVDRSPSR